MTIFDWKYKNKYIFTKRLPAVEVSHFLAIFTKKESSIGL